MNRLLRVMAAAALCAPLLSLAQNVVFNDSFTSDSLNPATYPTVTSNSTGWQILSNKSPAAPTETGGVLTVNMASTTSGFIEAQALFAAAPVQLLPGTYIELTTTFVPTNVLTTASDNLMFGFYNSGGTAPLAGLMAGGLVTSQSTFGTGGAKGWKGFHGNIPISGTPRVLNRTAQTGTNNAVQDVMVAAQSSSVGYSTPAGSAASGVTASAATLTNGNTYTVAFRLARSADGNTITLTNSIYNGTGTSNTGANTRITTYSGTFTGSAVTATSFDALAIGWRADAGATSNIKISALTVKTTGGTPWFTTQPPANIAVTLGDSLNLNAVVAGAPTAFQWKVSTDGGTTFNPIDAAANPSAATASLTLANIQNTDAGLYQLVATNAAGSSTSANTTVSVSATPVSPTISIDPVNATATGGTSTTLSVTANGTSPLTYEWQYSADNSTFTPIAGATTAAYVIPSVGLSDEGYYRVKISNVAGNATSAAAFLTVNQPLTINTQPVGAALNVGDNYTLSVGAVGRPSPQYQWYLNGNAINGATNATYAITSAAVANAGLYTVNVTNSAGDSVTSAGVGVAVLSSTLATTALTPAASAAGVAPDTRLTLTFNQTVSIGVIGTIKIFDTANPTTPVDTIDLVAATALEKSLRSASALSTQALPVQNKTIGGLTNFNYYPITVSGNTATIYPRDHALDYRKTYFVTVDPGVFTDSTGLAFAGITGSTTWTFSTKASGPASNTDRIVVATDGSGDFYTVQAALDWIPANNTTPRTLFIKNGTYFEQVYFNAKHAITFLGESRSGTILAYPNNDTFNNVSGTYHRMVLNGNAANDIAFANLTIQNTTPKGGAQAEALIMKGGARTVITDVDLYSFQDTLQLNGSAYVANSHISGDVDFLWGTGPCFFENCELTALTSSGYFTQIRNGNTGHGYVFLNCTLDAPGSVTGMYLARIDPNSGQFPYSEVVYLNCVMGSVAGSTYATPISNAGWLLNNTSDQTSASAPNVHFWEYNSHYSDGTALNVSSRMGASKQLTLANDATTITNYSTPSYVLGSGWTPLLAPTVSTQPVAQTISAGAAFTLTAQAVGVPAVGYQWQRNGVDIAGATNATYTVASSTANDAGTYSVVMSNSAATSRSATVAVVVHGAAPVIALQPASASALLGTTATLNVGVVGDGPFTYQWSKAGNPISDATNGSLRLTNLQSSDAASYAVAVTNSGGTTTSADAALTIVTPASTLPALPVIPNRVFNVVDYGAVADGSTDNAAAIQAALNAASAAGGGTVEIPPAYAAYLSGPITIPSNIDFQIDGGATLQALPYGRYPNSTTVPAHFITIASASTNIEFSGSGTIDGLGADWWAAFDGGTISNRPRLVQITKSTNLLFSGLKLKNSPMFNLAFSGANNNVTIYNVTISAPGDSPNTDGMDVAGTNFLIQGCSVSVGDDNIVAKPGSVFCRNIYIANCSFGAGHGVSVGGQTNVGLDGMTVTNCTFNGTDTGLRLKADTTQGGPVQNITYSNLTMTNVTYPIVFYSYYNQIGSPGAVSGSSQTTVTKVNNYNTSPPNSLATTTVPTWQNITLDNITATGSTGYSILWGLPTANALINNVTFNNVSLSGAGLELYDATNIQFTGSNTVGTIVLANALAITTQPQPRTATVGDSVTFTAGAIGATGVTAATPTYRWSLNGSALSDGLQTDGSTISGATTGTLTITNVRATRAGNYTLTASLPLDGYNVNSSSLAAGSLAVSATSQSAALTVNSLPGSVSLSNLDFSYAGHAVVPTVTTSPAGLAVSLTYNGSPASPVDVGTYAVVATIADPNYHGSTTGTLTITPSSAASISFAGLAATYDGQPHPVTAASSPMGIPVRVTYGGSLVAPTDAGSYVISATFADSNYAGVFTDTLVITKATQTVSFGISGNIDAGVPVDVSAAASSGLPLTYSVVSGNAALSGTTLIANPDSASVVIRATQAGDRNHAPASADVTLTVLSRRPQTISFATVASHLSNETSFALVGSASSGLPVTYTVVSGPAMVSGSTVTLTGAPGTVVIRATQAGNATYMPAPSVERSFDVADATTDTFFGDLVPGAAAETASAGYRIEAQSKSGDVAAAIVAGTKEGNLIIVAPSLGLNVALPISINADGTYSATFTSGAQSLTLTGTLANGVLSGRIPALNVTFSTVVQARTGTTAGIAGYYAAPALNTAQGTTFSIVGSDGKALVLAITPTMTTGGLADVTNTGSFTLSPTAGVTISGTVDAAAAAVSTTVVAAGQTIVFSGVKDLVLRTDRLVNLSARSRVAGGERIAISGFVIGGTDPKQVLIRAVGPGLTKFGVSGVLTSPHLQLIQAGKVIAENTGWSTAANASDIAAAVTRLGTFATPTGSNDSALLITLQPGIYSAQVSDGTSAGVALVEIYDASTNPQGEYQRLANISARGDVGTGENVLIGGFIVTGNSPKKLLIRGVGPGLAPFGVSGVLADPKLRVYQNTTTIAENDNWGTGDGSGAADVASAETKTGAFSISTGSKDAALVLTLAPGSYTAQVSGADNGTGVALIEVYEVP